MINRLLSDNPWLKQAIILAGNCVLIQVAVFCTFGALISSFSIPVSLGALFWIWLLNSLVISTLVHIYKGRGIFILMIPALFLFLWLREQILEGAKQVINIITEHYSKWISIKALFTEIEEFTEEPTVFIAAAGIAITFLLAFAICLRRSVFFTIAATAPVIFLTFVITDYHSDISYLLGIVSVYLTLLISSAYNPEDLAKRGLKFFPALAIALVLMIITYIISPYGTYIRGDRVVVMGNRIRLVASQMGRFGDLWQSTFGNEFSWVRVGLDGTWEFNTEHVSIADSGGRTVTNHSLLEVSASEPGTFYLRGYSMQHFDGRAWSVNDEKQMVTGDEEAEITFVEMLAGFGGMAYDDMVIELGPFDEELREELDRLERALDAITEEINRPRPPEVSLESHQAVTEMWIMQYAEIEEEIIDIHQRLLMQSLTTIYQPSRLMVEAESLPVRMDVSRAMPAIIMDFNSRHVLEGVRLPELVEMDVNRTGDITPNVTYEPYYGSVLPAGNDPLSNTQRFYYINPDDIYSFEDIKKYRLLETLKSNTFLLSFLGESRLLSKVVPVIPEDQYLEFPNTGLNNALYEYNRRIESSGIFTEIDPNTAIRLLSHAIEAGINPYDNRATVAENVARYIRSSADYTLTPGEIPDGEDFALYFLEELKEGYCIHYATAAVLMLRSLDIPARFVSGYVVSISPDLVGTTVTLTDRNAHAWVEVFYEDVGWLYLEVTPPGSSFAPGFYIGLYDPGYAQNMYLSVPRDLDEFGGHGEIPDDYPGYAGSATAGSGTATGGAGQYIQQLPPWLRNIVRVLMIIAVIAVILPLRRIVIIKYRSNKFEQKDTNEAVLYIWRFIVLLSRNEAIPPDDIEGLALKARFSQHQITEDERKVMIQYAKRLSYEVYSGKGDYSRIWVKYIRVFY